MTFRTLLCSLLFAAACGGPVDPSAPEKGPAAFQSRGGALTTPATLQNGAPALGIAGVAGSQTWFHFDVPQGATSLTVSMGTGTDAANDADLYVRPGDPSTASFACQSWNYGLTDSCSVSSPAAGGWSILVYGYTAYSGATLTATAYSAGAPVSVHLQLGIPDVPGTNHYLSLKPQFALSYNSAKKTPNWVSWELNASYLGAADRSTTFKTDSTLPSFISQAALTDYVGSGFDRGHMCPSADRTLNATDNQATFVLSNVVPQAANNNRGPWEKLEAYARTLAQGGKELTIVSGGLYGPLPRTIGSGVVVPDATFKVIVVADAPGAQSVTAQTRVIAVVVPNDDSQVSQSDDWRKFRTSARAIEASSGLNFLSDVPQAVQDAVETQVDSL